MSINRALDKEDVVYTYNGILFSHKKEENRPFAEMWIYLETVIQREVSQTVKTKYHLLMHLYESRKMVQMNLFANRNTDKDLENKHMDPSRGWGGVG